MKAKWLFLIPILALVLVGCTRSASKGAALPPSAIDSTNIAAAAAGTPVPGATLIATQGIIQFPTAMISTTQTTVATCPSPEGWVIYTVQDTDTIDSIAQQNNISTEELAAANCMVTGMVWVGGMTIYVPSQQEAAQPEATAEPKATKQPKQPKEVNCSSPYIVQAGDWIWNIGRRCNIDPNAIIRANNLANPALLVPGQKLILPSNAPPFP